MIENIYGKQHVKMVTCDGCGDGFESSSQQDALERMADDGWYKSNKSGHWVHLCPDCKEVD